MKKETDILMATTQASNPAIRKGGAKSLPFKIAITAWIDLLGYGEMIADVDYNPIAINALKPLSRLRNFHKIVAEHSKRDYRTLVLNDGAVAYRDLSLRGQGPTVDFFCHSWELFEAVQASEMQNGFPGARMVVAPGLRAKGSRRAIDYTSGHLDSILGRMRNGIISPEEAVKEASAIEKYFDVLPQLQANFAFSKSYIAEQSGSKHNLPGPAFYIDGLIFDGKKPDWIEASDVIDWNIPKYKLSACFYPVLAVRRPKVPSSQMAGFRDGLSIASILAPSSSISTAIHTLRNRF